MQVSRSLEDAQKLHELLPDQSVINLTCPAKDISPTGLESYLKSIFAHYKERVWSLDCLMSFLDDAPLTSSLTQTRISTLSHQVNSVEGRNNCYLDLIRIFDVG
jgi:hypothetical protein